MTKVVAAAPGMDGAFVREVGAADGDAALSRGTLALHRKSLEL